MDKFSTFFEALVSSAIIFGGGAVFIIMVAKALFDVDIPLWVIGLSIVGGVAYIYQGKIDELEKKQK